jgi:hypothetical protein
MRVYGFEFQPIGLFYFRGEKSSFKGTVKRSGNADSFWGVEG